MSGMAAICGLAALVGYLSLTQELLWMRAVAYVTGGHPVVFADVLGLFLLGVAAGALHANRLTRGRSVGIDLIGRLLALGAVLYELSLALCAYFFTFAGSLGMVAVGLAVAFCAYLSGLVFPILCHAASASGAAAGRSTSQVYFANIVGATGGPLITGFILMDRLTLAQLVGGVALVMFVLGGMLDIAGRPRSLALRLRRAGVYAAVGATLAALHPILYADLLAKLHFKKSFATVGPYAMSVETRSGIVAVHRDAERLPGQVTDVVYGGGMYDGTFNTDPLYDSNLIVRLYMVAALHRAPAEALLIGLSSGSWASVLLDYSRIRALDIVEINPGYFDIIQSHSDQARVLSDPKAVLHVDDGRRWLNRAAARQFDLIVMNTSFHWRDGMTNLLSEEFLRLCQSRLREGGVLYYNSTGSEDVKYTATKVFRHVTAFKNFVAASDRPFDVPAEIRRENLKSFEREGRKVFDEHVAGIRPLLEDLTDVQLPDLARELGGRGDLVSITDDNMASEFRGRDHRWVDPSRTWSAVWRRLGAPAPGARE